MKDRNKENEILSQVFSLVKNWRTENLDPSNKVLERKMPGELLKEMDFTIPTEEGNYEGVLNSIEDYLKFSVKTGNPRYLNQLFGGHNFPAFLGEIITALTNTSMYTYEVAPVATLMEKELIKKMNSFTGWEDGEGAFLTGGSNTNLVAMLLARNEKFPEVKINGLVGIPKITAFVSERAHFSFTKAANTLGIGESAIIKVQVDERGRMSSVHLEKEIEKSIARGEVPFFVGATTGTTETGSFDPIDELQIIAEKHKLWMHVDGSWGGSLILNENYRQLFKGLNKADSFSWNPHKLMNIPLVCSVLLIKKEGIMYKHINTGHTDYIFHDNDTSAWDLGPASLQCGRRVDALKLWLAWKYFGDAGYSDNIQKLFKLADYATELVNEDENLELMFSTESLNINFRYNAPEGIDPDDFNRRVRYRLIEKGAAMVNYCQLPKGLSIRLVLLNPELEKDDVKRFFMDFLAAAKCIEAELISV